MTIKVKKSIADRKLLWLYHEEATVRIQFFDSYVRVSAGNTNTKFVIPEVCLYRVDNQASNQSEQSEQSGTKQSESLQSEANQSGSSSQLAMFLRLCDLLAYGAQPTNPEDAAVMRYAATVVPVGCELFQVLEEYKRGNVSFPDAALQLNSIFNKEN